MLDFSYILWMCIGIFRKYRNWHKLALVIRHINDHNGSYRCQINASTKKAREDPYFSHMNENLQFDSHISDDSEKFLENLISISNFCGNKYFQIMSTN